MGGIGPEARAAVPVLIQALNDPDDNVRRNTVEVLRLIGSEAKEVVSGLIQALNDPNKSVRRNAAWALKKINIETEVIEEGDDEFDS